MYTYKYFNSRFNTKLHKKKWYFEDSLNEKRSAAQIKMDNIRAKQQSRNKSTQAKDGFKVVSESSSLVDTSPARAFGLPSTAFAVPSAPYRPIPPVPPGFGKYLPSKGAIDFVNDVAGKVGGTATAVSAVVQAAKQIDAATNKAISNKIKNEISKRTNKREGPPSGGSGSNNNNNSLTSGFSYNMMCDKPISKKIDLSTGVRSGLIVNPGEPTNDDDYSELYVMCGNLFKQDTIATSFREYIETVIFPEVQMAVQFNLNYAYELKIEDFNSWFYSLTKALEVYYTLDSVIAFNDNRLNTNQGCKFMRRKITSQVRLQYNLLRDVLGKQPIPPRVLESVRYLYQHFKFSELPGAPIYRLSPGCMFHSGAQTGNDPYINSLSQDMVKDITKNLTDKSAISNKIYQAMDRWHVPNSCMPPSCNEAYYDAGFRTFWFNSSLTHKDSRESATIFTRSGTKDTQFRYWLYTNNYDGFFFALSSFRLNGEDQTRPGMWSPLSTYDSVINVGNMCNALVYTKDDYLQPIKQVAGQMDIWRALQFDNIMVPYLGINDIYQVYANLDGSMQAHF
jgi:hypothetical protein